ncbi:poliovirus receptor homolog [Tupaia chinensis]|uniref:poliovirus receptor homolog n=1 Tax=Tupaia chinensis TaxID=246437 RepID=UPI000FFC4F00|nr:poliovirus receptor homolog [Tupaia chinensis]
MWRLGCTVSVLPDPAGFYLAGTGTVRVQAPAQVRGFLDEAVTLPCDLEPLDPGVKVTQVTWMRQEPAGGARSVAVFHPIRGPSLSDPERLKFVALRQGEVPRDASLAVLELRPEDEANYTCQFATFPQGSGSASTWLRVLAQPQNTAEPQEATLGPFPQEPVPVARCSSTGSRPPARITWSSHLNGMTNTRQVPGPLPGTFTVTSLLTLVPTSQADGQNVTCTVEHESLERPVVIPVTLAVRYPPEVSISINRDPSRNEITLTCNVRSNPEPTVYYWNTTVGPLPPFAKAQGAQLLIDATDKPNNITFYCSVTNALGTGQNELPVLLSGTSGEQSHAGMSAWKITLLVLGPIVALVLCVGALWYFLRFRQRRKDGVGSSANGDVAYSAVSSLDNSQGPQAGGTR